MKAKFQNIVLVFLIGLFSYQAVAFAEIPKSGSRLNIKPVTKKKSITFTNGKSVLAFKPKVASFDLKPAKTVNLYFANYLINRNLSKPQVKEAAVKPVQIIEVANTASKVASNDSEAEAEPGERLITLDGLNISNIYPNPADDNGYFDYTFTANNFKEVKIDFFNVLGSPMNVTVYLEKFDKKVRVNLKEFPNGFYFYQLIADGKTLATKKLLVRHYN
jgi:Secretion system C-terminal sorting domain